MSRPRSAQELVHWLEVGAGARWVRLAAVVTVTLAISLRVAWTQFQGPATEITLLQADVGRQLARGEGFTTQVNFPQTAAFLKQRGFEFTPDAALPELYHAPLYSIAIGGVLAVLPDATRDALFAAAPVPPDGFRADYLLLGLNLVLLWLAGWMTFVLARSIFDARVAWLAAFALLVSVPVWQQTVLANGTPLLMVLGLLAFWIWQRIDRDAEERGGDVRWAGLLALGAACGLLFLAEYSAGVLVLVAGGYAFVRLTGRRRWRAVAAIAAGFCVVSAPWTIRNLQLTGSPVGLALHNVALKAGDTTAEPATFRATLSADAPRLDLKKLGNKVLTSVQENLKARLWSGGAMWFTAFFVAGWLYAFRSPVANRLRWVFSAALGVLLLAQATLNSGESERPVIVWLTPLIVVFGAGFFFVLIGSSPRIGQMPRLAATVLLLVQALPLAHDALEPRRLHFHYPPYFPGLFRVMKAELESREQLGKFGLMADVPAGVAWYADTRVWAQPPRMRDFYAITLEQPIGELLLTPKTLDRPFFSELNARPILPGTLSQLPNRFGEWGGVYAGLLTGTMPRDFPLGAPQKLAENLYVLLNPLLPPVRGK